MRLPPSDKSYPAGHPGSLQPPRPVNPVPIRHTSAHALSRLIRTLCCAWLLLAATSASLAAPLIESKSVWRDDSATADFESARHQTYAEYSGVFTGGYTQAAHWIRLRISPATEPLLLRVRPHYLDDIRLYDPAQATIDGRVQPRFSGDIHPPSEPMLMSANHVFLIPGMPTAREIWLRIETTSTHLIETDVRPFGRALTAEHRQLLIHALLVAVYALTVVWALADWAGRRDPIMLLFAGKQMVLTVQVLFVTGFANLLIGGTLPPERISGITSLMNVLAVLTGFLFELMFLREFKPPRWLLLTAWLSWCPSWVSLGLVLAGQDSAALFINSTQLLLYGVIVALLAFSSRIWVHPTAGFEPLVPKFWLRGFYTLVFIATTATASAFLDLIDASSWALMSALAYGILSGVLIIALLQMRANKLIRSQREREDRLRRAEAVATVERERREEQSRFLAMLAHELKTPLSVIKLTLGSESSGRPFILKDARRAVDEMRAVIDRCLQADQLEDGARRFAPVSVDLDEMLKDVTSCSGSDITTVSQTAPAGILQTDPTILKMILTNLIDNALKYRAPDSQVSIEVASNPQGVSIAVMNAPGVAGWPDASKVFEKYYRSPGAHRETGSGLGLYLVSMLARLAGGTIRYAPTDSLVKFEIWIPRSISS